MHVKKKITQLETVEGLDKEEAGLRAEKSKTKGQVLIWDLGLRNADGAVN